MAADFLEPWYARALTAYNLRTDSEKFGQFFLSLADGIGLSTCESCISIGTGDGAIDIHLLRESFPLINTIKHYTSVDPNSQLQEMFRRRVESLGRNNLLLDSVISRVEDWTGPKEPVDMVMIGHCLYYVDDRLETIKRCLDWVKPGGTLCIIHDGDESSFGAIATKYCLRNEVYRIQNVRSDLRTLGIECQEALWIKDFDIRDRDPDIMNFLRQKKMIQSEFDELDQLLHEVAPSGLEEHQTYIVWSNVAST